MAKNFIKSVRLIITTLINIGHLNDWQFDFRNKEYNLVTLAWPQLKMFILKYFTTGIPIQLIHQTCWAIFQIILQIL